MEISLWMLRPLRSNFMAHQGAAAPILGITDERDLSLSDNKPAETTNAEKFYYHRKAIW